MRPFLIAGWTGAIARQDPMSKCTLRDKDLVQAQLSHRNCNSMGYALQVPEEANSPTSFASLNFSPDGKILAGVVGSKIYQLDAYNGDVKYKYSSGIHEGMRPLQVCFSPDNNFLLSGTSYIDRSNQTDLFHEHHEHQGQYNSLTYNF